MQHILLSRLSRSVTSVFSQLSNFDLKCCTWEKKRKVEMKPDELVSLICGRCFPSWLIVAASQQRLCEGMPRVLAFLWHFLLQYKWCGMTSEYTWISGRTINSSIDFSCGKVFQPQMVHLSFLWIFPFLQKRKGNWKKPPFFWCALFLCCGCCQG